MFETIPTMTMAELESNFSNFPIVPADSPLGGEQPFVLSFIREEDVIKIDVLWFFLFELKSKIKKQSKYIFRYVLHINNSRSSL